MKKRSTLRLVAVAAIAPIWFVAAAQAQEVLKLGVNGVMSGEAASWGLVNKYCAETTADMYNAKGGVEIGGKKYKIEVVGLDDKNDPKVSVTNAEKLTSQGIKYIIGTLVTARFEVKQVTEEKGYAFSVETTLLCQRRFFSCYT